MENRIPAEVVKELERRGHDVTIRDAWSHGKAMAIRYDGENGVISGGASPRGSLAYVLGW